MVVLSAGSWVSARFVGAIRDIFLLLKALCQDKWPRVTVAVVGEYDEKQIVSLYHSRDIAFWLSVNLYGNGRIFLVPPSENGFCQVLPILQISGAGGRYLYPCDES
jgi:hypothetical protein